MALNLIGVLEFLQIHVCCHHFAQGKKGSYPEKRDSQIAEVTKNLKNEPLKQKPPFWKILVSRVVPFPRRRSVMSLLSDSSHLICNHLFCRTGPLKQGKKAHFCSYPSIVDLPTEMALCILHDEPFQKLSKEITQILFVGLKCSVL